MNNNHTSSKQTALAEVVSSTLGSFTAHCWSWDTMPALGSLVCIQEKQTTVFGIVYNIQTGSTDPHRSPFPYQKTEDELRTQHPQIFEFLKTTFDVCITGKSDQENGLLYTLPAFPAKIHQFVSPATLRQQEQFFTNPAFLSLLLSCQESGPGTDDLFLAIISYISEHNLLTRDLFAKYYSTYSLLIGNDYRRLKVLLSRISSQYGKLLLHSEPPA